MIHSNFRKLMRMFARQNTGATYMPVVYNFTDITGYTGTSDDVLVRQAYCASYYNPSTVSNAEYSSVLTAQTLRFFAMVGNTVDNEHDYNLGEIITDNLKLTTIIDKSSSYIITTVITNTTSQDITFNEVGLFYHFGASSANWNGTNNANFLLTKDVLPARQTIPANSSISITFSLFDDNVPSPSPTRHGGLDTTRSAIISTTYT